METRFRRIHDANFWDGAESRSGPGSSLAETQVIRRELARLVREREIHSVLDIPCGDFNWIKEVPLSVDYIGADVVEEIVQRNTATYGSEKRRFIRLDITASSLPRVDLVLCRDLLGHLSHSHAAQSLLNIAASGSTFLLATTFPERVANDDIRTGDWRPLNLCAMPFSLPPPVEVISEELPDPLFADKSLGLWHVSDVPVDALRLVATAHRTRRSANGA